MPDPLSAYQSEPPHQADRRLLVAGNWKMNGHIDALTTIEQIASTAMATAGNVDTVLFPPSTLLAQAKDLLRPYFLRLGGQDCSSEATGAYTGEISAKMLADVGASFVLVGHSERRIRHGETDDSARKKALVAIDAGLTPIICIGESSRERTEGRTMEVLSNQIMQAIPRTVTASSFAVAYEPLWAIGSGQPADDRDIEGAHSHIRTELLGQLGMDGHKVRIVYGGSVKPENCGAILALPDVDGLLVGGASLNAEQFLSITAIAAAIAGRKG